MEELTGRIKQGDLEAAFVAKDYRFVFVPVRSPKVEGLPDGVTLNRHYGTLRPADNFLRGQTYADRDIMVYCSNDLELVPAAALDTNLYILSHGNAPLGTYDALEFRGGCLNSTFAQRSLSFDWTATPQPKVETRNDSIIATVNEGDLKEIRIGSAYSQKRSVNGGESLANTGVVLRLVFSRSQKVETTFTKNYASVQTLVQFMTFRKNVWFDEVRLIKNMQIEGKSVPVTMADCHWKDEFQHEPTRDNVRCIRFDALGPEASARLYKLAARRSTEEGSFSVDFIPESSRDVHSVSPQQLKDVCTALEVETGAQEIEPTKAGPFKQLKAAIKKVIKESRRGDCPLTDREYSYISGNMSHWAGPAAELDYALYKQREDSIRPLLKDLGIDHLAEDDVQGIIRMRNDLAHGGAISSTSQAAEKVLVLMGVVYSSILARCGCPDEAVSRFFERGLLTV